jgi:ABC-type Fe3+-hydroxamate transport system substrate-binding protein
MKNKVIKLLVIVFVLFSLCSCKKEEVVNETNTTNETDTLKLTTDETKKVYLDNSTYHVYYFNGNNITGYEQYVKYDYGVTASYIYGDIVEEYKKDSDVDEISPVGNYIKIKYKESKYGSWTLDSIKEDVSTYEAIY